MAEVAVNLVLERLIDFLKEEASLLRGCHTEVAGIKLELDFISSFLRDADARAAREESSDGVKTWVKHVREAAYGIEDVVDEYMLHVAKHNDDDDQHGFLKTFLNKMARLITSLKKKREMVSKIQELKQTILEIGKKRKRFGFNVTDQGGSSRGYVDLRVGRHFVESDELVGIEHSKNELLERLVDEAVTVRTVISLVGMGGIGKTTLANKVYDEIKREFDCHAWITVSQSNNTVEKLRTMIRLFHEANNEHPPSGINDVTNPDELIRKSREYLHYKRYLVVFDDVWNEDFWQVIQSALPENNNHSRIIITTRSMNVAEFCKKSSLVHIHNVELLSLEMSQELLCRTAFRFDQRKECSGDLQDLSFEIVRKCDRLPLAIVAIGGLLSTKGKDVLEWTRLNDNLSERLETEPCITHVKAILSLSYFDLPHYLKSCFLYVGVFPCSHHIPVKKLIRLWIAEGLVKENKKMTLEETAVAYLTRLINRSLVQVGWRDSTGRVRTCRVHDLIYDILLSKLEELDLFRPLQASSNGAARYLWIDNNYGACDLSRRDGNLQTHCIIFYNSYELHESPFEKLSLNFKLLRELDFENAQMEYLAEEIGNLWHLRYLSLRYSKTKKLPRSIGKLQNLLSLDLKGSLVVEIPDEIRGLRNLQYLAAYSTDHDNNYNFNTDRGVTIKGSVIGSLKSLEKIYYVDFQPLNVEDFGRELGRSKRLRKLGITKLRSDCGKALCGAIQQMHHLRALRISAVKQDAFLELQSMIHPPTSLERLRLHGRLEQLPHWISKLENLVKISLHWSRISDTSLRILGGLPKLMEFWLHEGYNGVELHFEQGQFQSLKFLSLRCLKELEKVVMDDGSLPCLENLEIGPSPLLQELPTNICKLECLKSLEFHDMPTEFAKKMLPSEGPDYWIVRQFQMFVFVIQLEDCIVRPTNWVILACINICIKLHLHLPKDLYSYSFILIGI